MLNTHYLRPMPDSYLATGYKYKDLTSGMGYRVVVKSPEPNYVAEVSGTKYERLSEAFAAANASGKSVKLLADYTGAETSLSVTNSYALQLNNHVLTPRGRLKISITGGSSFDLDGLYDKSVCSNVQFVVGKTGGSAATNRLHLVGGRYVAASPTDGVVDINAGTCLIDHGAILEGRYAVCMSDNGTLAVTNATIRSTLYAVDADGTSATCFLRIGSGAKVYGSIDSLWSVTMDLDISGDCEFYPATGETRTIVCSLVSDRQAGISGGFFYDQRRLDDKYLAKGYAWAQVETASGLCWTPTKSAPPSANAIRVEGNKVYIGDYEITGGVKVLANNSVELDPGGTVGGVKVTPVIGDLPPSEGESEPFSVGDGAVALTIQTIPGLTYTLLRGETPNKIDEVVATGMATGKTMTLEDVDKPDDGAFYRVKVGLE